MNEKNKGSESDASGVAEPEAETANEGEEQKSR